MDLGSNPDFLLLCRQTHQICTPRSSPARWMKVPKTSVSELGETQMGPGHWAVTQLARRQGMGQRGRHT